MLIRKQSNYDDFHCIAGACPKSCCIGWQIIIDETSLEKYKHVMGKFSNRLTESVDFTEGIFKQTLTRCAMLNSDNLCDLQIELGESNLCDTCRIYPRFIGEFLNLREYTLSLSCPEALRMLLDADYDFAILESKDITNDNPAEFADFDERIFAQIDHTRQNMLKYASNQNITLQERLENIKNSAFLLQKMFDGEDVTDFKTDNSNKNNNINSTNSFDYLNYEYTFTGFDILFKLEILESSWEESLKNVKDFWHTHTYDSREWHDAMYPSDDISFIFEKVFKSLLFSYLGGAVYDGQIYARTMIAIQSVRWLMMISYVSKNPVADIYLYSREVEHSDNNLDLLIKTFESEL